VEVEASKVEVLEGLDAETSTGIPGILRFPWGEMDLLHILGSGPALAYLHWFQDLPVGSERRAITLARLLRDLPYRNGLHKRLGDNRSR